MKTRLITLASIISILMLIALGDNGYGYYEFLRFATLLIAGYIAYEIYAHDEDSKYVWYFIGLAILFNPFIPMHLDKGLWSIINLLAAGVTPVVATLAVKELHNG